VKKKEIILWRRYVAKYYSRSKQKFIDIATMTDQYVRHALIQKCKHEPTEDVMFAQQQAERATRLEEEKISMGYKISEYKDRIISLENSIRKLNSQPTVTADAYNVAWKKIETLERHKKDFRQSLDDALADVASLTKECDQHIWVNGELKKENKNLKLENTRLVDRLERDDHGIGEIERQRDDAIFDLKQERNRAMMYAEMANDKCPNGHVYVFSEIPNDDEGREFVQKMKGYLNKESYKLRVKGQYLDEETKRTEGWKVHQYGQPISKSKCLRVYVDVRKDNT
jgi:chromosome segregation ATPase